MEDLLMKNSTFWPKALLFYTKHPTTLFQQSPALSNMSYQQLQRNSMSLSQFLSWKNKIWLPLLNISQVLISIKPCRITRSFKDCSYLVKSHGLINIQKFLFLNSVDQHWLTNIAHTDQSSMGLSHSGLRTSSSLTPRSSLSTEISKVP